MPTKAENGHPVWDEVIDELNELGKTLRDGGMPAVERKFRVTRRTVPNLPKPAKPIGARQVKAVREKVGVSQPVFAALLGVSPQTIKAWEQGTKRPTGAARRMLGEIDSEPSYWLRRLSVLCGS